MLINVILRMNKGVNMNETINVVADAKRPGVFYDKDLDNVVYITKSMSISTFLVPSQSRWVVIPEDTGDEFSEYHNEKMYPRYRGILKKCPVCDQSSQRCASIYLKSSDVFVVNCSFSETFSFGKCSNVEWLRANVITHVGDERM